MNDNDLNTIDDALALMGGVVIVLWFVVGYFV